MKIVDLKTFLTYPKGTVFAEYNPCIMGEIQFRGDVTLDDDLSNHAYQHSGLFDTEEVLIGLGSESPICTDQYSRMGPGLKTDQLFAILDKKDLKEVIERLQWALDEAKE